MSPLPATKMQFIGMEERRCSLVPPFLMAIALVRKRSSHAKEVGHGGLLRRSLLLSPIIFLLILLLFWSTSTLISVSFFHVCISSRKINLYCLSAGTEPHFHELLIQNKNKDDVAREEEKDIAIEKKTAENEKAIAESTTEEEIGEMFLSNNNKSAAEEEEIAIALKTVKEQMRALRSSSSFGRGKSSNRSSCEGRGIYVYDLPAKFNKELVEQCNELLPWLNFCEFFANRAMGKPIPELGGRWYDTHQYSLEPIFHSRVLNHHCRVQRADEAKLFYVPFYGGISILRWHFMNVSDEVKDSLALELLKWLETQSSWGKNSGRDHVFVLGKISWDFRRTKKDAWGTKLLELDEMQNPLKLLIERQPWEPKDVGVPHPTHFHPRFDQDILNWQSKIISSERGHLVSFAGGARSQYNIRSVLIDQCRTSGGLCRFLDCKSGECMRPASVIELFVKSEFCLQPPGDSPTRKSVFDSLVSGCIPVLFDPFTAYYQYPWHLPEDYRRYSVYIDQEEVRKKEVEVVEFLSKISLRERDEMRKYIVYELMPGLVYGDSNAEFEKFEDAFIISINNLIDRVSRSDS